MRSIRPFCRCGLFDSFDHFDRFADAVYSTVLTTSTVLPILEAFGTRGEPNKKSRATPTPALRCTGALRHSTDLPTRDTWLTYRPQPRSAILDFHAMSIVAIFVSMI